jgi:hypothetical protein
MNSFLERFLRGLLLTNENDSDGSLNVTDPGLEGLLAFFSIEKRLVLGNWHLGIGERLRMELGRLGGLFMDFGGSLSHRLVRRKEGLGQDVLLATVSGA